MSEDKVDPFQRLRTLIEIDTPKPGEVEESRMLVRAAINGACYLESALGFGQSFQSHMELLLTVLGQSLGGIDVRNLRDECHKYLALFEHSCESLGDASLAQILDEELWKDAKQFMDDGWEGPKGDFSQTDLVNASNREK